MQMILVGYDGSEPSKRAARQAAKMAKQLGLGVRLACVVPPVWLPTADFTGSLYDQLRESQLDRARALLKEAVASLKETEVHVETALCEGPPADELLQLSQVDDVEMIAMGTTSGHAIARVFLGSVAYRLLHLAKKPVLVVH
jgi:nucleotide-binding universal stress UspA family protein